MKVFGENKAMMETYGKILGTAEEEGKCSGMCPRPGDDLRLPMYLFSNVNDGEPHNTCKETIEVKL